MKKLVHTFLLLGALSQAAACIITTEGDDDDDDNTGNASFSLTWSVVRGSAASSCEAEGVDKVSALSTLSGTMSGYDDLWSCSVGMGTTDPLPLGDYTVSVSAVECTANCDDADVTNDVHNTLLTFDPISTGLDTNGEVVALGDFAVDFASAGNIAFSVDYNEIGGGPNCTAMGENVDNQEVSLFARDQMTCLPTALLFNGSAGLSDLCSEFATCQEVDVIQTMVALEPGEYDLIVEGLNDDGSDSWACFHASFQFAVDGDDDLQSLLVGWAPQPGAETFCGSLH